LIKSLWEKALRFGRDGLYIERKSLASCFLWW
jgi:hypothetical protein